MNYLFNDIFVEIDADISDYQTTIGFKVTNQTLKTFWLVEHPISVVSDLANQIQYSEMPDVYTNRVYWANDFCNVLNTNKFANCPREFFAAKTQQLKHSKRRVKSPLRSVSSFRFDITSDFIDKSKTTRQSFQQAQRQYMKVGIDRQIKYEDLHSLNDFDRFLRTLGYQQIRLVGKGAQTHAFKAINQQGQLIAVKVSHSNQDTLKAALLQQQLNSDMAHNMSGHTLFQHSILEVEDILVIEEDLANQTLEDILIRRSQSNEQFSIEEINNIIVDLVEQLYRLHIGRQFSHNDIKPENILIQNNRFILHDLGAAQYEPKQELVQLTDISGTLLYMSPIKLAYYLTNIQNQEHLTTITQIVSLDDHDNNHKVMHNPFKSDIYSLGLLILRLLLHNDDVTTLVQIENIFFHHRAELLPDIINHHQFHFQSERYTIINNEVRMIRPLLDLMLAENESDRISTLDLALLINTQVLASIYTPFTQFFIPYVREIENGYRVAYCLKQQMYEGQFDVDTLERSGKGMMFKPIRESNSNQKNIAEIFQRHRNEKKHQTILEEEESEYELSELTQLPEVSNHNRVSLFTAERFQPLYQGNWLKNLPHGQGKLNLYNAVKGQQHSASDSQFGKLINKSEFHQEELQFTIDGQFYFGFIHGYTRIGKQYEKYVLNISNQITTNNFTVQKQYYKFVEETAIDAVFGYCQNSETNVIDLTEVQQIETISSIVKCFVDKVKTKIVKIDFLQDKLHQQFELTGSENLVIICRKEQVHKTKTEINENVQSKQSLTCCCYQMGAAKSKHVRVSETVSNNVIETDILEIILSNLQLSGLKCINLVECSFSAISFVPLYSSHQIVRIQELDLSYSTIKDEQLSQLILSQSVNYLRVLNISHTLVGSKSINSLIQSENLNQLMKLYLSNTPNCWQFSDFIQSQKAEKLITLDISNNKWVDFEFLKCLQQVYLPQLREFNMNDCQLKSKELSKFKESPFGIKLTQLINTQTIQQFPTEYKSMSLANSVFYKIKLIQQTGYISQTQYSEDNQITDDTLKFLSLSSGLQSVERLLLCNQHITDKGVAVILQSPYSSMIKVIDLSNTLVTGEVLRQVTFSKLAHLKCLILKNCNNIDNSDVQMFVKSVRAAQIVNFYLSSIKITTSQLVKALKQLNMLQKTIICINVLEVHMDISAVLKYCLTWVVHQIYNKQLKKIQIDLSNCTYLGDGLDLFCHDIPKLNGIEYSLTFKIFNCVFPKSKQQELQRYQNIQFID